MFYTSLWVGRTGPSSDSSLLFVASVSVKVDLSVCRQAEPDFVLVSITTAPWPSRYARLTNEANGLWARQKLRCRAGANSCTFSHPKSELRSGIATCVEQRPAPSPSQSCRRMNPTAKEHEVAPRGRQEMQQQSAAQSRKDGKCFQAQTRPPYHVSNSLRPGSARVEFLVGKRRKLADFSAQICQQFFVPIRGLLAVAFSVVSDTKKRASPGQAAKKRVKHDRGFWCGTAGSPE
ncbi:hypothetical protein BDP55DRAFT_90703 [Colletotrichum godetiae]|uniref:Uncharacterized protein n=1 Tax=Colletotrichum godetiae TaxID=1209918 RepID=A0AAJ0EU80_9PEZI|nr:uncharacterized protein BDP55DRAFT_90703 [Colletotrichum godetiae]KAK1687309.1 hypothetical protein BDP55DRAFT_90703 [Colletotrichum godetiae]